MSAINQIVCGKGSQTTPPLAVRVSTRFAAVANLTAMPRKDPRVDAYIANAAPFARPILKHLRNVVHRGCPDVVETIKWRMPHFDYKGMFIGMAAFKQHCSFGFWQEAARALGGSGADTDSMGQFGRITSLADLPDETTLIRYVRNAAEIKDSNVRAPAARKPRAKPAPLEIPDYLATALKKNNRAQQNFDNFSYSHRKEYLEWITGAKREETRERRLATALGWIAEGKTHNWRYQSK